jgi:hypothetical protein
VACRDGLLSLEAERADQLPEGVSSFTVALAFSPL